jgi:hypothetical protein
MCSPHSSRLRRLQLTLSPTTSCLPTPTPFQPLPPPHPTHPPIATPTHPLYSPCRRPETPWVFMMGIIHVGPDVGFGVYGALCPALSHVTEPHLEMLPAAVKSAFPHAESIALAGRLPGLMTAAGVHLSWRVGRAECVWGWGPGRGKAVADGRDC